MKTGKTGKNKNFSSRHLYSIEYDAKDGTLTPLEGQPIIDLYRSLSLGGIVAFVGSGTSTLLGYKNWDALAQKLLELAETKLNRDKPDRLSRAIEDAIETATSGERKDGFDKYDSLALATEMLRRVSANGEDSHRSDTLRELYSFPRPRTVDEAMQSLRRLELNLAFKASAEAMIKEVNALSARGYLPIDYIRGIALVDALVAGLRLEDSGQVAVAASQGAPDSQKTQLLDTPSPSIDVLGTLRKDWKVTRYATLNYDHEIERMLERNDFPFESITHSFLQSPSPKQEDSDKDTQCGAFQLPSRNQEDIDKDTQRGPKLSASSRLGEKARSVDLDRSNVAEFMLFGADSPAGVSQVLHLHGSARNPAQMIVTDIDYNRRYFLNSSWNEVLEDSQQLLYRGNAIVFIGVGMSEDVLFRAMRILSQVPEREMRPVYAFMASKGDAKDTADGIKLFQRYGIRTIFYGSRLDIEVDQEAGNFNNHPLVEAVVRAMHHKDGDETIDIGDEEREAIAKELQPLSVEQEFLKLIERLLGGVKKAKTENRPLTIDIDLAGLMKSFEKVLGRTINQNTFLKDSEFFDLPRLTSTRWHGDVFRLVWTALGAKDSNGESLLAKDCLRESLENAVSSLTSAIHSRALQDALQAISAKSIEWRTRWRDRPQGNKGSRPWHFRAAANAIFKKCDERVCSHNISQPHSPDALNRRLLRAILADESGADQHTKASMLLSEHRLVIARARNGTGKGMLASSFSGAACPGMGKRLVVSFGQSCGRDAVFDLLANQIAQTDVIDPPAWLELIVSRVDIVMTGSEKRPKLAEWDVFFDKAIRHPRTRMLVLCENEETVDYFKKLAIASKLLKTMDGAKTVDYFKAMKESKLIGHPQSGPETIVNSGFTVWDRDPDHSFYVDLLEIEPKGPFARFRERHHVSEIARIAKKCKSVWVSSFLTAVYAEIVLKPDATVRDMPVLGQTNTFKHWYGIGIASFDDLVRRIDHVLNITQDPRQRVPNLVDVAMSQIEGHTLRYRDTPARITKVISHAILKHLFAFGGPVENTVFVQCPEFQGISTDYRDRIKTREDLDNEINKALGWLRGLDMVTQLTHCYNRDDRYGLHSHVRNWLATKKGLPFSVVMGREQTAITVVPLIDEEIVPLDREDYRFIWDTIDGLLEPADGRRAPSQAHIRAAYMLLRGSMRIGAVLRSAHDEDSGLSPGRTPLEEYVRRLLDVRHAALACGDECADVPDASTAPLFEREWVWLFNEIGVVKLLQGQAHDASALFEQAIEFESERLHDGGGFEALVYGGRNLPSFSISKLRVMMNLALAEIERGAFNRAGRILSSEKRDLEQLSGLYTREDFPKKEHREIRILQRVLGLINARLKFLAGGAGEATKWLEDNEAGVVGEGVHGLTALYFLIRADVEAGRKSFSKAAGMFSIARAEAEASGRSDLIFSVMLGESELRIISQGRPGALQLQQQLAKIRKIKHEAQRMGMARVVVTACILRARLYLGFGEYRSARQDLMTALTLSTASGLNIKRASALIDMAALVGALDAELRNEARDIARSARFDAERMGYKLAAARAKDLELVLREQGSIEDWLFRRGAEAKSSREEAG